MEFFDDDYDVVHCSVQVLRDVQSKEPEVYDPLHLLSIAVRPEYSLLLDFRRSMMFSLVFLVLRLRRLSLDRAASDFLSEWCLVVVTNHSCNRRVNSKLDEGVGAIGGWTVLGFFCIYFF